MRGVGGNRGAKLFVIAALVVAGAGCSSNILHGVDERSANDATAALERAGIGAEKLPDESPATGGATFTIRVSRADSSRALDLLRSLGLPRDQRRGLSETYAQPSLIPTASEERARYLDAVAGEIERTLESVDGVVSARVHLVLEEHDPLAVDAKPRSGARAAVLLKARPGRAPLAEGDVQRLVAGSVAGLDPTAVAVVTAVTADGEEPKVLTLASLGPLRMTPGSRPILLAAFAAALLLLALLAGLLLVTARRLAALERAAAARHLDERTTP